MNAKTTILLSAQIHRYVCDDGKPKWQHPVNIQRLAESDTDTSLTTPSSSADTCTHKYKHTHTPRPSIVRQVCQAARELQPTLTASASRLHSAQASLFKTSLSHSNWLKPEQVVILFWGMFWRSKTTSRVFTYTNHSIKSLLRLFETFLHIQKLSSYCTEIVSFCHSVLRKHPSWQKNI